MNKAQLITKLITNSASGWTEADRTVLESFAVERLATLNNQAEAEAVDVSGFTLDQWLDAAPDHLKPGITELKTKASAPPVTPTQNQGQPVTLTPEQWMAACPANLRDSFAASTQLHNNERIRLTGVITANAANTFTVEQLAVKPFGELQALAALAAPITNEAHNPYATVNTLPNFFGNGSLPVPTTNAAGEQYDSGLPVQNWGSK